MKKLLRPLALLLVLALLAGCGAPSAPPPASESEAPAVSAAPTPEPEPTPVPESFPFDFTQVLADTEELGLSVTALGLDGDGNWVFHLYMENRAKVILNIRFLYQSINGIAIEPFTYRLAIGDAVTREFRVFHEVLENYGSSAPVEWAFTLRVSSAEDNRDPFIEEPLSVCPFGEDLAVRYEFVPSEGDRLVMSNNLVSVYITGYSQTDSGFAIEFVAVNHSDKPLRLMVPELHGFNVNGHSASASLCDEFGAYSTLIGYLPVEFPPGEAPTRVESLHFRLATEDPTDPDNRKLDRWRVVDLLPDYPLD